jgi:predicted RNA binding protein YcfA (HicA-like mRNA interferase family)
MKKLRAGNAYGRKLITAAADLGWDCKRSGGGHLQFNKAGQRVTAPGTPRDPDRSLKKTLSRMRRLSPGLDMVAP